jgi:hypothetical protein
VGLCKEWCLSMLVGGDGGFEWKERVSNKCLTGVLCMTSILVGSTHMGEEEEEEEERGGRRRTRRRRGRRRRRRGGKGREKGREKGPHTPHAGAKKTCESAQIAVVADELRQ